GCPHAARFHYIAKNIGYLNKEPLKIAKRIIIIYNIYVIEKRPQEYGSRDLNHDSKNFVGWLTLVVSFFYYPIGHCKKYAGDT
ncbi:hypothetical protein, partial [Companilactobacillus bobalius]|uniref:hypothetical protein n=1 Tax=Companilactobacillus bobalius TaxID=2801451 RepID=UPI001F231DBE